METISVRWELGKYHSSSSTSVSSTQLHEGASICSRCLNFGQWNGKGGNHLVLLYQYVSYRWVVCTLPWYCCPLPRSIPWPTPTSLSLTLPLSVAYVPSALSVPTHARKELHQSRDHFHVQSQRRLITIYLTQV